MGRETARLVPPRRRALGTVESYASAAAQIDLAVRNVRVLARGVRRAVDLDENVPDEVVAALRDLAAAVRALDDVLGEDDGARAAAVREPALRAAGQAAVVLERTGNMSVTVVVGQIRSTAVDILRSSGMSYRGRGRRRPRARRAEPTTARRTAPARRRWRAARPRRGARASRADAAAPSPRALSRAGRPGTSRWSGRRWCPAPARCRSAGSAPSRRAVGDERAGVDAALADRRAGGGAQRAAEGVELLRGEVAGRAAGREPRPPQRLVGEQVPDAGEHALVEQPRLQRRRAAADARAERGPPDLGGVRADVGEVRLEHRPAEPALVAQREPPAVRRTRARSGPSRAAPACRRRRSGPPCPGAGRAPARRRPSPPTGTCRAGAPARAGARPAPRRSRPARAGGTRRCRGRPRRRSRGPGRARSAGARARPRAARAWAPRLRTGARRGSTDYARPRERRLPPRPRPPDLPRRARLERAVPRQGAAAAADEVFLDLEDAVAPGEKERARGLRHRRAARAALRRPDRRGARQRDGHAALLPRPDRRRRAGGRPARRRDAPQGPHARRRRDDRQAARARSSSRRAASRAGSASRRRSRTRPACSRARRSPPPRRGWRRWSSGPATTAPRSASRSRRSAARRPGYPGDHLNYVYSALVVAARAAGIQAIDGPYAAVRTTTACASARGSPGRSASTASGPSTRARSRSSTRSSRPAREEWERAEAMLAAYGAARRRPRRGDVRGRDDRRGEPQDGGAARAAGARRAATAPERAARARVRPARRAARAARAWSTGGSPSRPRPPSRREVVDRPAPRARRRGPRSPTRASRSHSRASRTRAKVS